LPAELRKDQHLALIVNLI